MILALNLLCGISQAQSQFVSDTLRFVLGCIPNLPEDARSLLKLPRDYCTTLNHFDLDPRLRFYICCPSCCALYDDDNDCPDSCTIRSFPSVPPCSAQLKRTRSICGSIITRPVRRFAFQGLKDWLARILSYPDMESALEAPLYKPSDSSAKSEWGDVFDAGFI